MIVNSRASAQEIKDRTGYNGKVFPIDANGISMEIIGQARPNTVILGKLVQVAEIASLSSVKREFRKIFESKLGKTATDKNIAAIEKAYDTI